MTRLPLVLAAALLVTACGDDDGGLAPDVPSTRFDLLGAGLDTAAHDAACKEAGMDPGCDPCVALGWLGDGVCDQPLVDAGFCAGPDPDCTPTAADLYVAPDGDDENPGTEAAPLATVDAALAIALPGSLVYLRGGTYHPTDRTLFRVEGTPEEPIVIRAYPGETPVFDGGGIPEGDTQNGSTATWHLNGAKHLRILGPIHLTNGRGAGLVIEGDTEHVELNRIESSYNGQTASRAGHGFLIVEDQWADVLDVHFVNCDAHHNANHLTKDGEDVAENLYQHGDGFRIKSGREVRLTGCRAWNNLDDGYDLVWATHPIRLSHCWAAATGKDDAQGTLTGTPGFTAEWGEGIKLGYATDTGRHECHRCLSWDNVHLGYRMDGGPYRLLHCASFRNGRRALGWDLGPGNVLKNNLDFETERESDLPATTTSLHNSWDEATSVTVTEADFLSTDPTALLGPRGADGSLPVTDFLRLAPTSDLVDAGIEVGLPFAGDAPDIGCFERY